MSIKSRPDDKAPRPLREETPLNGWLIHFRIYSKL
jgi:hypothetical protein